MASTFLDFFFQLHYYSNNILNYLIKKFIENHFFSFI